MSTLQEWAESYPGDPEALRDALVQEIELLRKAITTANDLLASGAPYGHVAAALAKAEYVPRAHK